jgi:hypothetical protein
MEFLIKSIGYVQGILLAKNWQKPTLSGRGQICDSKRFKYYPLGLGWVNWRNDNM